MWILEVYMKLDSSGNTALQAATGCLELMRCLIIEEATLSTAVRAIAVPTNIVMPGNQIVAIQHRFQSDMYIDNVNARKTYR